MVNPTAPTPTGQSGEDERYWREIVRKVEEGRDRIRHVTLTNHEAAHLLHWAETGKLALLQAQHLIPAVQGDATISKMETVQSPVITAHFGPGEDAIIASCYANAGDESPAPAARREEVLEADVLQIRERGQRGEALTACEQSAWTGYELGWCHGFKYASPTPAARSSEASNDLSARCAEIVQWRNTGLYTGTALTALAETAPEMGTEPTPLRWAEDRTIWEALTILALPTSPGPAWEGIEAGMGESVDEDATPVLLCMIPDTDKFGAVIGRIIARRDGTSTGQAPGYLGVKWTHWAPLPEVKL